MISAFCWGSADHGQLFTENDEPILSPKEVKLNFDQEVKDIVEISCSEGHTLIVTSNGSCYACGCNDYGQIGHDSANKLGKVSSLNNQKVMSVVAGSQHSLALTEAGEVFSWGDNSCGQLGRGKVDENQAKQPKVIKTLVTYHIIQICSGNNHSLALSNDGIVFSWGANNYGQLGTGSSSQHMDIPQPLLSIRGIPVSQIIAGGNHCFILSMSGALFGWGRNSFGQLGVNDENDRNHPTQCKSLRQQRTVFVSCGEDHTCTLTQEGGVFTFGCGSHGQLGHDNTNNEILPRRVMDMMGTVVTQIACGRRHTLTYVPETGRIYSFGSGSCGQLGLGNTDKKTSPVFVPCPFMSSVNSKSPRAMEIDGTSHIVSRIFSGGNKCIVLANKINSQADEPSIGFLSQEMTVLLRTILGKCVKARVIQSHQDLSTVFYSDAANQLQDIILAVDLYCTDDISPSVLAKFFKSLTSATEGRVQKLQSHTSIRTAYHSRFNKSRPVLGTDFKDDQQNHRNTHIYSAHQDCICSVYHPKF
ncbi:HERC4 [Mytilus edulis]|uniref:HERC4 n=1 Tax=Mytilus edulis TaxID=6550 RepID=A0A8S3RKD3_MYTED|nr:HERC4 [Mytilus edulis]